MDPLREHVLALLKGGQAYETFDEIVSAFSPAQRGLAPPGSEHSPWQIIEHMRVALRDTLDYSQNENGTYREKKWPDEYWATSTYPVDGGWEKTVLGFHESLDEMRSLVADEGRDLLAPFPWGEGQTLLKEALLASDHIAYHLGELVELKRWLSVASG